MKKQSDELWRDRRHVLWFPFSFLRQDEHECLLYRILDISLRRTLGNRFCGTGTVTLRTTDASDPLLTLKNIKHSRAVKEMLSNLIEEERTKKGITGREVLTNSGMMDRNGDGQIDIDDFL